MLVATNDLTPYMVGGNKVESASIKEIEGLIPEILHHLAHQLIMDSLRQ